MSPPAPLDGIGEIALGEALLALYRTVGQPDALAQWAREYRHDLQHSTLLTRHLRQAHAQHERLRALLAERQVLTSLLDRLPIAVLLVDDSGAVLSKNAAAATLTDRRAGLAVTGERIRTSSPESTKQLAAAIREVVDGRDTHGPSETALIVPRPAGRQPLYVLITRVPCADVRDGERRPAAAVFISDPEKGSDSTGGRLSRLFHLTPAETRVALGLTNGSSVNELAGSLDLSRNTVRWHVKHVLQKAGVKTQAQFVRLVHRSPAGLS